MQNGPGGRRGRFRIATNKRVNTRIAITNTNVHELYNAEVTTALFIMKNTSTVIGAVSLDKEN